MSAILYKNIKPQLQILHEKVSETIIIAHWQIFKETRLVAVETLDE